MPASIVDSFPDPKYVTAEWITSKTHKQKRIANYNTDERRARTFAHLMVQGKVKATLRMLSQDSNEAGCGPLTLTKDIS